MRKHVISGLLALLFLLALPLSAAAHAVPDESRNGHCSITVSMTYKGKAVRGGTLALYKVGDVAEDDGNYSFVPVEEIQADIPEFGDIESPDLAGRLAEAEQVLCIVNTRKRAQQVYEGLPEEGRFHLSTLMIPTDREETLNVIRARLRNGQVCRVVSTSLVEAGVDVDFPSVWRELAGLDSILQAAGRCNREGKRSAAESVVHVFETEGKFPTSMMQQREAATEVMGEFEEINTRPAIRAYFNRLLWVKGDDALDAERILNSERACTFRKTAEAFRLIDADTCTVYVPNEGNAEDIAQLRAGLYSRALIRRLGRSSVNVYQNEYKNLVFAGIVEDHQEDGFGILIQPDAYKPKCGLSTEAGDGFLAK